MIHNHFFNRYIYNNRDDKEFMMETIHIHRDSNLLFDILFILNPFSRCYILFVVMRMKNRLN